MKSIWVLASLLAVSAAWQATACAPAKDDEPSDEGGRGATGGKSGNDNTAGEVAVGENAGGGGEPAHAGETGSGGDVNSGAGGASEGTAITACTTGKLLAGDPLWTDSLEGEKPAGQGLLDDPPVRNEAIAVIGTTMFVETEFDLWSFDMSKAEPQIARIAGTEPSTYIQAGVPCKDTRFLVVRDMTATADGKLVLIDYVGGAIIEITDPAGPKCASHWVAGTHEKTDDPGQHYPLSHGDHDGPGAEALFGGTEPNGSGIHKVAVDPVGNIYTWDEGTGKVKLVGTDPARTVSTIGVIGTDNNVMSLAFLQGKLYATGVDGANDFLLEIDPEAYNPKKPTANVKEIFRNRGEQFPEVAGTGHQAIPADLESDGEALIVSGQSQFVWRMSTNGTVLATLAGSLGERGPGRIEYEDDFNPTIPHPAAQWQLGYTLSNVDGGAWLALSGSTLFWSGGFATGKHILQFTCK